LILMDKVSFRDCQNRLHGCTLVGLLVVFLAQDHEVLRPGSGGRF
jgi:hypothetical protein